MKLLPVELLYCVRDFLEPFDQINMNCALKMNIPIKNLKQAVENFSSNGNLQLILYKIITIERRTDHFNLLKDVFEIIKHEQVCWRNCDLNFKFNFSKGEPLITQNSEYNYDIFCLNNKLKYYLVKYLQFEPTQDQVLSFSVKCNVRHILQRSH